MLLKCYSNKSDFKIFDSWPQNNLLKALSLIKNIIFREFHVLLIQATTPSHTIDNSHPGLTAQTLYCTQGKEIIFEVMDENIEELKGSLMADTDLAVLVVDSTLKKDQEIYSEPEHEVMRSKSPRERALEALGKKGFDITQVITRKRGDGEDGKAREWRGVCGE
ncbi:hypothetical protein L873DRAFT_1315733 [Choiromyces venosus 120613-1]|uniref:Uncharacterized protein n=1 Tax=Choiromyces venosus 120613-1 TaxID=1336337 RepID=A0A3N4JGJ2_9PEZI|nr:hypothetical protein L873DRAFT_1315733 [Choiromyces venosus 120613-1]